jgi:hypothetical protein
MTIEEAAKLLKGKAGNRTSKNQMRRHPVPDDLSGFLLGMAMHERWMSRLARGDVPESRGSVLASGHGYLRHIRAAERTHANRFPDIEPMSSIGSAHSDGGQTHKSKAIWQSPHTYRTTSPGFILSSFLKAFQGAGDILFAV